MLYLHNAYRVFMVQVPKINMSRHQKFFMTTEGTFFFFLKIFIMLYSLRRKHTAYFFSVVQVFLTQPSNSPVVIEIAPERER